MKSRLIVGVVALCAVSGAAIAVTLAVGDEAAVAERPDYARVDVRAEPVAAQRGKPERTRAVRVLYLRGDPTPIDIAATGPYIDVRIASCPGRSRVVDGGVLPSDTNVYEQASYVEGRRAYHVRIGYDDEAIAAGAAGSFQISSHLTCLKGVR